MMHFKKIYFSLVIITVLTACVDNNKGHLSAGADHKDTSKWPVSFGIGRMATKEEIAVIDIDVTADGHGLLKGSGNIKTGKGTGGTLFTIAYINPVFNRPYDILSLIIDG